MKISALKKYTWVVAAIVAVCAVTSMAYAIERQSATSETVAALELIDSGMDWDRQTPITLEQKTDRMNANVAVLAHQKSQRNQSAGLGAVLLAASVGIFVVGRRAS